MVEENQKFNNDIPEDEESQKRILRSLMNIRMPGNVSDEFIKIQDEYLKERSIENLWSIRKELNYRNVLHILILEEQ